MLSAESGKCQVFQGAIENARSLNRSPAKRNALSLKCFVRFTAVHRSLSHDWIVHPTEFHLSLGPFRQVVKDYFQICESYFDAVKKLPPSQIEAIDMGRRGIHNEGARVLQERLEGKADIDIDTARRLFTLICVLHWGG